MRGPGASVAPPPRQRAAECSPLLAAGPSARRPQQPLVLWVLYLCGPPAVLLLTLAWTPSAPPRSRPTGARGVERSSRNTAAVRVLPCVRQMGQLCGAAPTGQPCLDCVKGYPELDPANAGSPYFCEKWDLLNFCFPGVPQDLAPAQREESLEPGSIADFVLDSYAVCRRWHFAIEPTYVMLMRVGCTAMLMAWLSLLPQPIGSGEPSVPGNGAVVLGVVLVGKAFYSTVRILCSPVPDFATDWYEVYQIKWWAAATHPSFNQAVCVVLTKLFGWVSTEVSWDRRAEEYEPDEGPPPEAVRNELDKLKAGGQPRHGLSVPAAAGGAARGASGRRASATPSPSSARSAPRSGTATPLPQDLLALAPPKPPGDAVSAFFIDVAKALKPPASAALSPLSTRILKITLNLALLGLAIVGVPLAVTHILPALALLTATSMLAVVNFSWWRAFAWQLCAGAAASLLLLAGGGIIAYLKQCIASCRGEDYPPDGDSSPLSRYLPECLLGKHAKHPNMLAARAVFVKGLALVAAVFVIFVQNSITQMVLLHHRAPRQFLTATGVMLLASMLAIGLFTYGQRRDRAAYLRKLEGGREEEYTIQHCQQKRDEARSENALGRRCLYGAAAAVLLAPALWSARLLAPALRNPAEVFDSRVTCPYVECSLHSFSQGTVAIVNHYVELVPFASALLHTFSPVPCFYTVSYYPPRWLGLGMVIAAVIVLSAIGYLAKRHCLPQWGDNAKYVATLKHQKKKLCWHQDHLGGAYAKVPTRFALEGPGTPAGGRRLAATSTINGIQCVALNLPLYRPGQPYRSCGFIVSKGKRRDMAFGLVAGVPCADLHFDSPEVLLAVFGDAARYVRGAPTGSQYHEKDLGSSHRGCKDCSPFRLLVGSDMRVSYETHSGSSQQKVVPASAELNRRFADAVRKLPAGATVYPFVLCLNESETWSVVV
eukprot:TRINITY_DN2242_c1_g1_i1.p1 TRINITY_DN2242_c1_g1~~TRINITY_DN2242_c1_g1_i1.p1  ORF type:complete len:964 (+),score=224.07 TRINITY_DN2242_c1_g1_i1:72-2894(+)